MRTLSRLNFYGTHFFSVELIEGKVLDFVVSQKVVQLPLDLVVADSKSPQRSSPPEEVAVAWAFGAALGSEGKQVWSRTKFCILLAHNQGSVSKGVFLYKHTLKICVRCRLAVSLHLWSSRNNAQCKHTALKVVQDAFKCHLKFT